MALINPLTGSSKFNARVQHDAVISLAGDEPTILEQSEEITKLVLLSDASNGEPISHKDLEEVPNEEIDENGFWIHSKAAKLKGLSQEELIALVLKLQGGGTLDDLEVSEEAAIEEAEEPAEEVVEEAVEEVAEVEEEKPKKRKKRRPAPKTDDDEEEADSDETEEVAF